MFYQKRLLKFKYLQATLPQMIRVYNKFIFETDANDVVSIYGIKYENNYESLDDATDRDINIVGTRVSGFTQIYFIKLLQDVIHFKARAFYVERDWEILIFIGQYHMNLMRYAELSAYESLFPTDSRNHELWVVNVKLIGTSTYFIDMFNMYLWLAFFVSFTLIGVVSSLGTYLFNRYTKTRFNNFSWFSTITNQGGEENSRYIYAKIMLVSLSILSIIFHDSFGVLLSSYLAIREPDLPFKNFDELMKTADYSVCTPAATTSFNYITNHLNMTMGAHHHRINDNQCPDHFKQFILNTKHYVLTDFCPMDKTVYFIPVALEILTKNCPAFNMRSLPDKYLRQYNMLLVSPGFVYREQFNRGLIILRTAGFYNFVQRVVQRRAWNVNNHLNQMENIDLTIDFHQTQIILLLPLVGIVVAIIILVVELIIKIY